MSVAPSRFASHLTLGLCTILHAFTHAFGAILTPLYLLIRDDLNLPNEGRATLLVTVYGLVYCLGSLGAGILADRFDRRVLLGVGLVGNAAAIVLMGLTRQYELLIAYAVMAGLFGTLFHPAANALVPAHYPKAPGMAIGILGAGAGLGFFAGPQYAGWRAEAAGWQAPLVEMGLAGVVCGIVFLLVAREAGDRKREDRTFSKPLSWALRARIALLAVVLGCRDFVGIASITLASLYLQKAHGLGVEKTGLILGSMMLIGTVVNPLMVYLSPGRRRLPALAAVLFVGGAIIATVPWWPVDWVLVVLCLFQAANLGSYAISDAAMLERTPPPLRGRVVGLFLTLAGTMASTGPWVMGSWTTKMGEAAARPESYVMPFFLLAALMAIAALGAPIIAILGRALPGQSPEPISELRPATLEAVGG
jgi:MFS family permease